MQDIRADDEEEDTSLALLTQMSIDDRVRKGQISFIEADDTENESEEEVEILHEEMEMEEIKPQISEDQRIINETIGKEDTFVSSYTEDYSNYRLPRLSLLKDSGKKGKSVHNINAANDSGRRLIEILDQFGVKASLIATHTGRYQV